jgi:hypothetical protein
MLQLEGLTRMANTDKQEKLPDFAQEHVGQFSRDDKIKQGAY